MAKAPPKIKTQTLELKVVGGPHNGKAPWQFPDPVTGTMIGGQVAYIRCALRHKRFVAPWGRRAGKTTGRPFLWSAEAMLTAGEYVCAFIGPNHVKAWEMFQFCLAQFGGLASAGGLVTEAVGEPESQNRYLKIAPINPDAKEITFERRDPVIGPRLAANFGKNEGSRIYFLSGSYPQIQAVQGFPFRFDRISVDEAQQQHPNIVKIVNPMLLDSGGSLDVSGIADADEPGNAWFQDYYEKGLLPENQKRWCSLNFPTYCNPNLDAEAMTEIENDLLTSDEYDQYIWAKFLSGSGAVFHNLAKVFVLEPKWSRTQPAHRDLPAWMLALLVKANSDSLMAWVHEDKPIEGHRYAATVDFAGRTKTRDSTVISVFDLTENRQVCLIKILDMQSPDQLHWIEGVKTAYGCEELHGDNTPEGAALMAYLRERHGAGIRGHVFSASNKAEYVKRGVFLFEMAEVRLIKCEYQEKEFREYKRVTTESKLGLDQPVSYSHPPGRHDDSVSAFLQIAPSMAHGRRAKIEPEPTAVPVFEEDAKTTTLERFVEGEPTPWSAMEDGALDRDRYGWGSIQLPPGAV